MRYVAFFVMGALLAGCNSAPQDPNQREMFGRVDCQIISGNKKLELEYEHAKAICLPRAEAAALTASASIPVGQGLGGSLASGIERGTTQREVGVATAKSCMAERGYFFKKGIEHDIACGRAKPPVQAGNRIN